jgi:tetratricopeptide (TPR) repeat protein
MMPTIFQALSRYLPRTLCPAICAVAFGLVLATPAGIRADEAATDEPPSLSDDVSDSLTKLQPLLDAKNWSAALNLVDGLLPTVQADSYDQVVILDIKARVYLQMDDLPDVVDPWERALALSDKKHYFSARNTLDIVDGLGRVLYSLSGTVKDPDLQKRYLDESISYMKRWLDQSPKPTEDAELGYAEVLYNKAVADPTHVDQAALDASLAAVNKGMHMSIHPKDGFYEILIAALQMRNDFVGLTQYLELLVNRVPTNRGYWEVLIGAYMNLATSNEKDKAMARSYFARAINALERAQALGMLRDPQHYYNLATMYYEAGQTGRFTELLDTGLTNGTIQSTAENWGHLAYCYQLVGNDASALDALKRAAAVFPDDGDFDFKIGQLYSQMDNTDEAYAYSKLAVSKSHLDKPFSVYVFLAYNAFQLKKLDEAKQAADKAAELPDARRDKEFPRLREAIDDAIKAQQMAAEQKANEAKADAATDSSSDAAPDAAPERISP